MACDVSPVAMFISGFGIRQRLTLSCSNALHCIAFSNRSVKLNPNIICDQNYRTTKMMQFTTFWETFFIFCFACTRYNWCSVPIQVLTRGVIVQKKCSWRPNFLSTENTLILSDQATKIILKMTTRTEQLLPFEFKLNPNNQLDCKKATTFMIWSQYRVLWVGRARAIFLWHVYSTFKYNCT